LTESLIPFGIHRDTGEIVEPEDATKGRACNCLCPGCKAPLLSRHPKAKRYHFAHDSKHEEAKPEEECPFSSAVAVAMMVREVSRSLVGKRICTPEYKLVETFTCCTIHSEDVLISKPAQVLIEQAEPNVSGNSHHFDLKIVVGGYPIYVDLVYKGKPPLALLEAALSAAKAGVLELNCDSFSTGWFKTDKSKRFSEAVIDFVLEEGVRIWRYHPRQFARMKAAKESHQCTYGYDPVSLRVIRPPSYLKKSSESLQPQRVASKKYYCVMCDKRWVHMPGSPLACPGCGSHLYAREV